MEEDELSVLLYISECTLGLVILCAIMQLIIIMPTYVYNSKMINGISNSVTDANFKCGI